MSVWALIVAPFLVAVVLFFVLPMLEKPRQKFLKAIGVKHNIESQTYLEIEPKPRAEAPVIPTVDPIAVVNDVGAQPLMQQADKAKHYIGMRVDCIGEVFGIEELQNKKTEFNIRLRSKGTVGRYRVALVFEVDQALYRGISLLEKHDPVRVSGIIETIDGTLIWLREAKLISYGKSPSP